MSGKLANLRCNLVRPVLALMLLGATSATAQTFNIVYSFLNGEDGCGPGGRLVFDAQGNLFGVTSGGPGNSGYGTVFKLTPDRNGSWSRTLLYTFDFANGARPHPPVIFDRAGNIYFTLQQGGDTMPNGGVLELSPASGVWRPTIVHAFQGSWDGWEPYGGLTSDNAGHLYGATSFGGVYGGGVVFQLGIDPSTPEIVLADFNDGANAPVTLGPDGNIYGSTYGGSDGNGTIFKLSPNHGAQGWKQTVLHNFNSDDGDQPTDVIFDAAGNLYGATVYGGNGYGVVFKLTPNPDGSWSESTLYAFRGYPVDGRYPNGGLTIGRDGSLYGATLWGGTYDWGTEYKLTPSSGGQWTETILHNFSATDDGGDPGPVVLDSMGNVYGMSAWGQYDCGVVFQITP